MFGPLLFDFGLKKSCPAPRRGQTDKYIGNSCVAPTRLPEGPLTTVSQAACFSSFFLSGSSFPASTWCKPPVAAALGAISLCLGARQESLAAVPAGHPSDPPPPSSSPLGGVAIWLYLVPLVPAHNNRLRLSRGSSHHRLAIYLSVEVVIIYEALHKGSTCPLVILLMLLFIFFCFCFFTTAVLRSSCLRSDEVKWLLMHVNVSSIPKKSELESCVCSLLQGNANCVRLVMFPAFSSHLE